MTPVRLEPAAPLSPVKHSTTESLRSLAVGRTKLTILKMTAHATIHMFVNKGFNESLPFLIPILIQIKVFLWSLFRYWGIL